MAKRLTQAAPEIAKILFENDRVRIVELKVKKGTKIGMHTHPAYFAYGITSSEYKSKSADGKTRTRKIKQSDIDWSEGESHEVEFVKGGRALVVELK